MGQQPFIMTNGLLAAELTCNLSRMKDMFPRTIAPTSASSPSPVTLDERNR